MKIRISLHGFVREYAGVEEVVIDAPEQVTAEGLRDLIEDSLMGRQEEAQRVSLSACALGTEQKILRRSDIVPQGMPLLLLPPVNGG